MFDHVTIGVRDLERSRRFYEALLGSLGIAHLHEAPGRFHGYGREDTPSFWITLKPEVTGVHIAFAADSRAAVAAFHAAGLAAGGADNGPPGLRPQYHPSYYAAFVLDPDGHNIEAVCHRPDGSAVL